jgi:hypothetical protein
VEAGLIATGDAGSHQSAAVAPTDEAVTDESAKRWALGHEWGHESELQAEKAEAEERVTHNASDMTDRGGL